MYVCAFRYISIHLDDDKGLMIVDIPTVVMLLSLVMTLQGCLAIGKTAHSSCLWLEC